MKKAVFIIFFINSLYLWSQIALPIQQSNVPKTNLVVNYDFSKSLSFTRGNSTVNNIAGAASGNATIYENPIFMKSLGFISLDGVNQYLITPNLRTYFKAVNTESQKSFTMSLWIYPKDLNGVIISEHDSQTLNTSFFTSNIELVNGVIKYKVWDGSTVNSSPININQWYHIAMVYDGASLKGYLNGILQGVETYERIIHSNQFYGIGSQSDTNMGSGAYGEFNLSQFKLFNLPLSDNDILQEFESRKEEFDYIIHSPSTNSNPQYWSVSSVWASENNFNQTHYTPWLNNTTLGWAAKTNDLNQWITLNYDKPTLIKGVVFQGRANNYYQWVEKANIETSLTSTGPWTRILSGVDINNVNEEDVKINFPNPVFTKYVKVLPTEWNNHITLRMGLLVKPNAFTDDDLVLHYNPAMIDSYPGTGNSLIDISGNGINGTMSNITYSDANFTFNGTNSQVSIPDNAALEPGSGSWTIEVWFKTSDTNGTVIGKYNNGGSSAIISYALRLAGTNLIRADFSNGSRHQTTDNYTFTGNKWVQMVYVWDKNNNQIYTYSNGELKQTKNISITGSILDSSKNLFLGSYNGGEYSQWFNGQMGIVRLYKKALNANEIFNNFEANKDLYNL